MSVNPTIEALARMWMECDPNRQPCDPDAPIEPVQDSNGNVKTTDLTGKPRWHWFIPRAEASVKYLAERGLFIGEP